MCNGEYAHFQNLIFDKRKQADNWKKHKYFFLFDLWSLIYNGLTNALFTFSWKRSIIHHDVTVHRGDPQYCHLLRNFWLSFWISLYYILLCLIILKPIIINIVLCHSVQIQCTILLFNCLLGFWRIQIKGRCGQYCKKDDALNPVTKKIISVVLWRPFFDKYFFHFI